MLFFSQIFSVQSCVLILVILEFVLADKKRSWETILELNVGKLKAPCNERDVEECLRYVTLLKYVKDQTTLSMLSIGINFLKYAYNVLEGSLSVPQCSKYSETELGEKMYRYIYSLINTILILSQAKEDDQSLIRKEVNWMISIPNMITKGRLKKINMEILHGVVPTTSSQEDPASDSWWQLSKRYGMGPVKPVITVEDILSQGVGKQKEDIDSWDDEVLQIRGRGAKEITASQRQLGTEKQQRKINESLKVKISFLLHFMMKHPNEECRWRIKSHCMEILKTVDPISTLKHSMEFYEKIINAYVALFNTYWSERREDRTNLDYPAEEHIRPLVKEFKESLRPSPNKPS